MIDHEIFGHTASGEPVHRFVITGGGLTAHVLTYGAVIQDLRLEGHAEPLVLGFERFEDYPVHSPYFGATPGRLANRVAGGHCVIDGKPVQLEKNEKGIGHLHGGSDGLAKRVWTLVELSDAHVVLSVRDPDGRAGFPGNCDVTVTYRLLPGGTLSVRYETVTDKVTIANLCQHSYFNLDGSADILGHVIEIAAEHYLPVDAQTIPTGEQRPVSGTPFDFRTARPVGESRVDGAVVPYDHNFCLSAARVVKRPVARLTSPLSGISMAVSTTEPGVQFYAGSKVNVAVPGLGGKTYRPFAGLCLETQVWPDAINHPEFPNSVLRPGERLVQETDYVFSKA